MATIKIDKICSYCIQESCRFTPKNGENIILKINGFLHFPKSLADEYRLHMNGKGNKEALCRFGSHCRDRKTTCAWFHIPNEPNNKYIIKKVHREHKRTNDKLQELTKLFSDISKKMSPNHPIFEILNYMEDLLTKMKDIKYDEEIKKDPENIWETIKSTLIVLNNDVAKEI